MPSNTTMQYYDLLDALAQPKRKGCAICRLVLRSRDRYLESLLYEYTNTRETHDGFRAGRGLCNAHSWQAVGTHGNALNVAILFNAALDEVQSVRPAAIGRIRSKSPLADALEPTGPCAVCKAMNDAEQHYIEVIADACDDPRFTSAFADSAGFCLPHLRHVLRAIGNTDRAETFITMQRGIWDNLRAELEEYIAKLDLHYQGVPFEEGEADSWRRTVALLTGESGVFGLQR